jgi:hypothetical protein
VELGMPPKVPGMVHEPAMPWPVGPLGPVTVLGLDEVLGPLGAVCVGGIGAVEELGAVVELGADDWACAMAGTSSTDAIESKGWMGSFFKTISPRCQAPRSPGACARTSVSNEAGNGSCAQARASHNGSIAL